MGVYIHMYVCLCVYGYVLDNCSLPFYIHPFALPITTVTFIPILVALNVANVVVVVALCWSCFSRPHQIKCYSIGIVNSSPYVCRPFAFPLPVSFDVRKKGEFFFSIPCVGHKTLFGGRNCYEKTSNVLEPKSVFFFFFYFEWLRVQGNKIEVKFNLFLQLQSLETRKKTP